MADQMQKKEKKVYSKPTLKKMGNLREITLGNNPNTSNDQHGSPTGKS